MEKRTSLVIETVFYHRSKIDLIREAHERGFRVFLHLPVHSYS